MRLPLHSSTSSLLGFGLLGASFLALLAGCGVSEYKKLLGARQDILRTSAPFRILFLPTQLPGTPLKIRVPMIFKQSYTEDSKHSEDGAKIKPDRLQPPFLQLPGFKFCYEGHATDPNVGRLPYYCYVAAIPSKPGDAEKLEAELQGKLKSKLKETPDAWEPVDAYSPNGKGTPWKKIRVVAEQPFYTFQLGQPPQAKPMPGIFELWVRDTGEYIVLVGWRTPSGVEGPPAAPSATPAAANQPAPEGKPDLSATPTSMPILTAGTLTTDDAPPVE
jgi:hypothetical protein